MDGSRCAGKRRNGPISLVCFWLCIRRFIHRSRHTLSSPCCFHGGARARTRHQTHTRYILVSVSFIIIYPLFAECLREYGVCVCVEVYWIWITYWRLHDENKAKKVLTFFLGSARFARAADERRACSFGILNLVDTCSLFNDVTVENILIGLSSGNRIESSARGSCTHRAQMRNAKTRAK